MPDPILLKNCRFIVTMDGDVVLEDASIAVRNGKIECVGETCGGKDGVVLDCRRGLAMPALYNAHTHAAMTLLRGFHDDAELHVWLKHMWRVEEKLDPWIVYLASRLAAMEMASTGTAGFIDMYFHPLETVRAASELGLRVMAGPVLMNDKGIGEWRRELGGLAGSMEGLAKPVANVHSLYMVSPEIVEEALHTARELGAPLHIHVSETRREVYEVRRRYGRFPVELMNARGMLGRDLILVHMGWAASWEYDAALRAGAGIVHCPASNMKLATAGQLPLRELLDAGGIVALGTDGAASNNSLDMFREMRTAVLLQRHGYWDTRVTAMHVLSSATRHGASLMGVDGGVIREGAAADIAVLDSYSLYLQPLRKDNVVSAIVYSATGRDVTYTIVDGKLVYSRDRDLGDWSREAAGISARLSSFLEAIQDS